jgi:hypothetical protein
LDKIIAIEVLEHVANYISALGNIRSLLKEKVIFVASTPWIIPLHDIPNDFHRFTWYEINRMLEVEGFNNIIIESRGNFFDSMLALGVRGFFSADKYSKLTGILFILITTLMPNPKRYVSPQYSCIGYNFSATY